MLTDKEKDIVRRTRNTKNHHLPKNSNVQEYMYATAFEGLIGYLHLTKNKERLEITNKKSLELDNNSNEVKNMVNNLKTTYTNKDKYVLNISFPSGLYIEITVLSSLRWHTYPFYENPRYFVPSSRR